ncbi:MAG: hypothetical protein CMG59_05025 [Candidatus Marinimicrobia bacterium]|nr:hypothetical protein [Candidatus Neomarinimicrobiota bacterium]
MIKLILLNFVFFFLYSCSASNVNDTLTSWQSEFDNQKYWYGIAIINDSSQANIHDIARNQAIIDIASQIKVEINQKYTRKLNEENYNFTENTFIELNSNVANNFENIEILHYKSFTDSYMLLARLSKKKYNDTIIKKKNNTKKIILDVLQRSKETSWESLNDLAYSIMLLSPFVDDPIYYFFEGKEYNLLNVVNKKINEMIDSFSIKSEYSKVDIKSLYRKNNIFKIKIIDSKTNKELKNVPLYMNINDNIVECVSDEFGNCEFKILNEYLSKDTKQYGFIALDTNTLSGPKIDKVTQLYKFDINIIDTKILIRINEENLGKIVYNSFLESEIIKFFRKNYNVIFVSDDDCDVKILIDIITQKKDSSPNEYGLYQANVKARINLISKSTSLIKISVNELGLDFNSFENASENAMNKIRDKILDETLDELVSILIQN